ncbi:MAG: S41 family peptidase, partial [Pyrinomonadaceae bacterium]
ALAIIEDNYVDGNKLDYNVVTKSSIYGMLRTLDPHSNYFDRKDFDEMRTDERSEYFGIGAAINNYTKAENNFDTYVTATFQNSPAARAGIQYGDKIVEVDGIPMNKRPSADVRDRIRGPRGTMVKVKLERARTGAIETIELTRDAVAQPSIPDVYMVAPDVGYIAMTVGFNYTTADELQAALEKLHAQGAQSIILDLRNNGGGFLDQAIRVADKFLERGQLILTQRGRIHTNDQEYRAQNGAPDKTPLVVLINGFTASASEIVVGALQDHDRALLVGENSFGKGLVQTIIPLEYGSGLTLTSAKYYTPSGRLIQRDYSGGLYDYLTQGRRQTPDEANPTSVQPRTSGTESHTDGGRVVYSGGGITPDVAVKARTSDANLPVNVVQAKMLSPLFFFARDLSYGRVKGFENYKIDKPIDFNHELKSADFVVTGDLYKSFKNFISRDLSTLEIPEAQLDRNREFIERQLRYNMVMASYGT